MDDAPGTVAIDESVFRALLRLAVAAGTLGNGIEPEPDCCCHSCELSRSWRSFANNPDVSSFVERKLAVEAAVRLLLSY